jgi:tetratricopeptide (TPR) repeat protein
LEQSGEFAQAFKLYQRATRIDPPHPAGYAGMKRVRGILHERAKLIYAEGVLAESFSDFANAERKFKEVLKVAPSDDIYFERSQKKISNYNRMRIPAGLGGGTEEAN